METAYQIIGERKAKVTRPTRRLAFAARPAPFPLPPLPSFPDATFLRPQDSGYPTYLPLHNKRNDIAPALRILCTSTQAVSDSIKWVRDNDLPFALRCGGHCYEGFSQSNGVVIDIRKMGLTTVNAADSTVTVSAGANLGKVYKAVAAQGFVFAGGSCPTVGVAGHTLGGGFGLLGRRFGLACDNLKSIRLVDAAGNIKIADATQETDHFWAARGGGGGSFAAVTRFVFGIHALTHVRTFSVTWRFANTATGLGKARQVFDAWQNWAPRAPKQITAIMKVQRSVVDGVNRLRLSCIGQTTGTLEQLESELNNNLIVVTPTTALSIVRRPFIDAVSAFGGSFTDYETIYMDARSDFLTGPLPADGIDALFAAIMALPSGRVAALCDPYGGAVAALTASATAFPRRGAKTWAIQYYSRWTSAADTDMRVAQNRQVYDAMRPFMSGAAYVNYPDADLPNYATAYWGSNLPRLKQIKQAVDPGNLFRHGQSVPVV